MLLALGGFVKMAYSANGTSQDFERNAKKPKRVGNSQNRRLCRGPKSGVVGPGKPRLWNVIGPSPIVGAADDDPSGIAAYSQAGTRFGYHSAWALLLTYHLVVVTQGICARLGRTTPHTRKSVPS